MVSPPAPKLPVTSSTPASSPTPTESISPPTLLVSITTTEIPLIIITETILSPHELLVHNLTLRNRLLEILLPAWMRTLLTRLPIGTETRQVIRAQPPPHMLLTAIGPQRTEALVVVRAGRQLALGVDVEVQALVAVGAVAVPHEEVALGHLAQVVLVQELAALPLLAQRPQPVLAHQRVVARVPAVRRRRRRPHVPVRALRPERAVPCHEGLAYRSVRRQPVSVGRAQERREREVVVRCFMREDLLRKVARRGRGRGCYGRHLVEADTDARIMGVWYFVTLGKWVIFEDYSIRVLLAVDC